MSENTTVHLALSEAARALETITTALATLRDEAAAHEPLAGVLDRLAHTVVAAVPEADAVSVTHLEVSGPRTIALTDESVAAIDDRQYEAGRGPCLQAATSGRPVRAVVGEYAELWPEFTAAAREAGVRAYLSVPLLLATPGEGPGELVGSFNIYARSEAAFDPFDETLMELFSTAASAAIGNARRWLRAHTQVEQLTEALTTRADIDQAKGALMVVHRITADEAFARLTDVSQRTNTKLYDVARSLMAQWIEHGVPADDTSGRQGRSGRRASRIG